MSKPQKYFSLFLPVFKQGDDLFGHLDQNQGNAPQAFLELAQQYEAASQICRRVASVLIEIPKVEVDAGSHHIGIMVPASESGLSGLLADEIIEEIEDSEKDPSDLEDEEENLDEEGPEEEAE